MSIYERRKDGPINLVLRAKLFNQIIDFAKSDNIQATDAEIEQFLAQINQDLDKIIFINLNSKKQNNTGGSCHVHYAIPANTAKGCYQIRFLHGLVGRCNEYYKEFGALALNQLYKQHLYNDTDLMTKLTNLQVLQPVQVAE